MVKYLMLAMMSLSSFAVMAQDVCFYQHGNYQGSRYCMNIGEQMYRLNDVGLNDAVSSVLVSNPQAVALFYVHSDFRGSMVVVDRSVSSASRPYNIQVITDNYPARTIYTGFNDTLSSVKIVTRREAQRIIAQRTGQTRGGRGRPGRGGHRRAVYPEGITQSDLSYGQVCFYKDTYLSRRGSESHFCVDVDRRERVVLDRLNSFDDAISSIGVGRGNYAITICRNDIRSARPVCRTLEGSDDIYNLSYVYGPAGRAHMDNDISYIEITRRGRGRGRSRN